MAKVIDLQSAIHGRDDDEDDEDQGDAPEPQEDHDEEGKEHAKNLAEDMDEEELDEIGAECLADYKQDYDSCEDMRKAIRDGLEMLGTKIQEVEEPFPGACGASHPLLLEACVQFQARAIQELFPAAGPVLTRIMGVQTHELLSKSQRVREFMNYQITEEMHEYYEEEDAMLFALPLCGTVFKKTWFDDVLYRPIAKWISPDDFVMSYTATDLRTCGRYTHVLHMPRVNLKKMVARGFYRDVDLPDPGEEEEGQIEKKVNEQLGRKPILGDKDSRFKILEQHRDLDNGKLADDDGCARPYIVTLDHDTQKVLAIRRNWAKDDDNYERLQWFTRYIFIPSMGAYGYGFVHLLGNLTKTATAALRNMIDAGTFSNLPAGFKLRGARVSGGSDPVKFGEWRDLDAPVDDIKKALLPMPVKEPSATLFQLLELVVSDGRRLASITDMNVGDMDTEQPVGTTLAGLEQGLRVMTAIHKRLHKAKGEELRILKRINRENMPDEYPYNVEGGTRTIRRTDFDAAIDVVPVSDPNQFSETQRIMKSQAQLQLAQQFPQQHNLYEALYRMHETLGTSKIDKMLVPPKGPKPMDPVTEEFAVMHGGPIMAYPWQDHQAHLQSHMAFMQNPQLGANPALAQMLQPAMLAHIADHQGHLHRLQIQAAMGVQLPPPPTYNPANPNADNGWQPMSPQVENAIAQMAAQPAQMIARNAAIAQQAQQNQQLMQSPEMQVKMGELKVKQQDSDTKRLQVMSQHGQAAAKAQGEQQIQAAKIQGEQAKMQLQKEKAQLELQIKVIEHKLEMQQMQEKMAMESQQQQQEFAFKGAEMQMQHQAQQAKTGMELQSQQHQMQLDRESAEQEAAANQQMHEQKLEQTQAVGQQQVAQAKLKTKQQAEGHKQKMAQQKQMAAQKAKQPKAKP